MSFEDYKIAVRGKRIRIVVISFGAGIVTAIIVKIIITDLRF